MALLTFIARRSQNRGGWPTAHLIVALLALSGGSPLAAAPGQPAQEYQIKAVFLFNFAQFVEWPAAAFPDPNTPITIGVLGDDPFGPALHEAVRGESVKGRALVVRRFRRIEEIDACHILFIGPSENARLDLIVASLRNRHILTVSDAEGAAQRGVMIRFFTENKRIRLRINLGSARTSGLLLSSKLLRPAQIVGGEEPPP